MTVFDKREEAMFLSEETRVPSPVRRWISLLDRHHAEVDDDPTFENWAAQFSNISTRHLAHAVNAKVNALHYMTDHDATGLRDAWLTPTTTLRWGGGDCEDLAILKLLTLRYCGWADSQLVLVTQSIGPFHAVCLAPNPDGAGRVLLDNQFSMVHEAERAAEFAGYKPRIGMDIERWWRYRRA